jgi:hypothetical protein
MKHADLHTNDDTREVLTGLRSGQIRKFRGPTRPDDVSTFYGFFCTTDPEFTVRLEGVDSRRVDGSILRLDEPVAVAVVFGHLMFDHSNGAPGGPDWHQLPFGLRSPDETGPYQAALVYGDARVTPDRLALRFYHGEAGQSADAFRLELLSLLACNE